MWPFSQSQSVEVELPPAETPEERDREITREIGETKAELATATKAISEHLLVHKDPRVHVLNGTFFVRVNALFCDPRLQSLEGQRLAILRRFWALLDEKATLKKSRGLAAY